MKAEKQSNLGSIIFLIIAIIIGVSFLYPLSSIINRETQTFKGEDQINISLALINANNINTAYVYHLVGSTDLGGPGNFRSFVLANITTTLIDDTDYILDSYSGTLTLKNTSKVLHMGVEGFADYEYGAKNPDNTLKVLLNMVIGLFALTIIVFIISKMASVFTDN